MGKTQAECHGLHLRKVANMSLCMDITGEGRTELMSGQANLVWVESGKANQRRQGLRADTRTCVRACVWVCEWACVCVCAWRK